MESMDPSKCGAASVPAAERNSDRMPSIIGIRTITDEDFWNFVFILIDSGKEIKLTA